MDTKRTGLGLRPPGEHWSGEATRGQGFAVQETRVDVTIGEADRSTEEVRKERPVWMVESTVIASDPQVSYKIIMFSVIIWYGLSFLGPVSYTHLDVYKRQAVCKILYDSV